MPPAMLPAWLFLGSLILAPQVWWPPMLDWSVDFFVYPFWLVVLALRGRIASLLQFTSIDWLFLFFIAWIAFSVITNGLSEKGVTSIGHYAKYFLLYRLVVASIESWKDQRAAGHALLAFAVLIAVEGIQHANSSSGLGWAGQTYSWIDAAAAEIGLESRIRWVGIFDGPGVLCVLFTSALPFAFQYMLPPYSFIVRVGSVACLAAPLLLASYYTGSRGGIIATAATVGLFGLSRVRLSAWKLGLAALVLSGAVLFGPSYLTDTRDSAGSAQGRVNMWAKGIEMAEENPLFGIGRGDYATYTGSLVAHNSGLEALGETGFVGAFLWFALLYMAYKGPYARFQRTDDLRERQAILAFMLSLSGYLVSSLFVSLETELQYYLVAMGAAVAGYDRTGTKFTRRDATLIMGLVFIYYACFKIFVMYYY